MQFDTQNHSLLWPSIDQKLRMEERRLSFPSRWSSSVPSTTWKYLKKNFYIHIDIDINDHICIQYGTHIQKLCPFRSHISFCFPYRPYPWKATMSMEPEHHRTPPSSAKPSSPCTAWHAIFGQVDSFWLGPSRGNPGIQNSVFNYMIYKMIYEFHETKHPTC